MEKIIPQVKKEENNINYYSEFLFYFLKIIFQCSISHECPMVSASWNIHSCIHIKEECITACVSVGVTEWVKLSNLINLFSNP